MVTALLIAAASFAPGVEDYYPLTVGAKWHYQVEGAYTSAYVDEVVKTATIDNKTATIVISRSGASPIAYSAYRVEDDTIFAVAYDEKKPLPFPQPILKVGDKPVEWSYEGLTQVESQMQKLQYKAVSTPKGRKKILGEERDVVEVKMDAVVYELKDLITTRVTQVISYAKGIGMCEMTETSDFGGKSSVRKVKLVRFEPPK